MMSFDASQLHKNKCKDEMTVESRQKPKLRASSSTKMEISADMLRSEGNRNRFWFFHWLFLMLDPNYFDSWKAIEICTLFIKKKLNRMIGNLFDHNWVRNALYHV